MDEGDEGDEVELVRQLQAGDESAFVRLVDRYHVPMLQLARTFVGNRAAAEDAVQETWVGVIRGVDRFEGRSSLRTWLFSILVRRAKTAGAREHRSLPVADAGSAEGRTVPADRFTSDGRWAVPPTDWSAEVDDRLTALVVAGRIRQVIDELPDGPRRVVTLRDVEGLTGEEVCAVLGITEANQRVLLHRGRARIRAILEDEMGPAS